MTSCWKDGIVGEKDVLVMSCMGCHLGASSSTELRTECVIDVVQATSYLGTAVVFLYKASCKPNSEPKLFSSARHWIHVESSEKFVNKKRARHVRFADARLRAFVVG